MNKTELIHAAAEKTGKPQLYRNFYEHLIESSFLRSVFFKGLKEKSSYKKIYGEVLYSIKIKGIPFLMDIKRPLESESNFLNLESNMFHQLSFKFGNFAFASKLLAISSL